MRRLALAVVGVLVAVTATGVLLVTPADRFDRLRWGTVPEWITALIALGILYVVGGRP